MRRLTKLGRRRFVKGAQCTISDVGFCRKSAELFAFGLLASCGGSAPELLDPWPFNVPRVELGCQAGRVFVTTPEGTRYAANGSARAAAPYLQPILAHHDASAVIQRGLSLCEQGQGPVTLEGLPRSPAPRPPAAPSTTLEDQELGEGVFVTVEAEAAIEGRRPRLALVCDGTAQPSFQLYLIQAPASPPPLRGTYGTFTVDDGESQRIELGWGTEDAWMPSDREKAAAARLVRAFVRGSELRFTPPAAYSSGEAFVWRATTFAPQLEQVRRWCAR